MALEREITVRQVEDEPGKGFFQTTIEEGGVERQDRVPALDIKGNYYETSRAYIQQQLETGVPVVAYRAGKRGQCVVAVNQEVVAVETARQFDTLKTDPWQRSGFEWTDLSTADNSTRVIGCYGRKPNTPKLEFTGTNKQTELPIKITVGFVC